MKYQVVGFKNNQLCLITLEPRIVVEAVSLSTHQHGPKGGIVNRPTPEDERVNNAKAVDHSLTGVINKHKKEEKK